MTSKNAQIQSESFISLRPDAEEIKPYISYYYFHKSKDGSPTRFIFYPHVKNGLTIYKNSKTRFNDHKAHTIPCDKTQYQFLYSGIEAHAIEVVIHPPFDKIGIAFQPLGLNYFVDRPLSIIMKDHGINFDYFRSSITETLEEVYALEDPKRKVNLLDEYFLSQYKGLDESRIIRAVHLLTHNDLKYNVASLAAALAINRKTLLRLFQKHLNCSVKDYIHIVQFRKAVEMYQESPQKPQLGEVAHMHDYYDQSDFIKHFKKITGFNPKKFFSDIQHVGREDTFWTFVK